MHIEPADLYGWCFLALAYLWENKAWLVTWGLLWIIAMLANDIHERLITLQKDVGKD